MGRDTLTSDFIGFLLGFFLGCCGLLLAALLNQDYLRGAVLGIAAQFGLSFVLGAVGGLSEALQNDALLQTFPWELLCSFAVVTVFFFATIAGAIWAFGGRSDDDDDESPPPADQEYVSYTRR